MLLWFTNVVASSPIKAFILRKIWLWVLCWHSLFDGFSEVGVTENLLFPWGVVGPRHGRGVQLPCRHFYIKHNTNKTYVRGDFVLENNPSNSTEANHSFVQFLVETIMNREFAERTGGLSCPSL